MNSPLSQSATWSLFQFSKLRALTKTVDIIIDIMKICLVLHQKGLFTINNDTCLTSASGRTSLVNQQEVMLHFLLLWIEVVNNILQFIEVFRKKHENVLKWWRPTYKAIFYSYRCVNTSLKICLNLASASFWSPSLKTRFVTRFRFCASLLITYPLSGKNENRTLFIKCFK